MSVSYALTMIAWTCLTSSESVGTDMVVDVAKAPERLEGGETVGRLRRGAIF